MAERCELCKKTKLGKVICFECYMDFVFKHNFKEGGRNGN